MRDKLEELLLVAIGAVISGAESWTAVSAWGQLKLVWLRQHLPFTNGIASRETFGRVFALLNAQQFERCFMRWIPQLCPGLAGEHIAINGKSVRGSHDGGHRPIHLASAWSATAGLAEAIRLWFASTNAGALDRPFWDDLQVDKDHDALKHGSAWSPTMRRG